MRLETHTFIQLLLASPLLPNTVRETLIEHAEKLTDGEREGIAAELAKTEQLNAQAYEKGIATMEEAVHGLRNVQREAEEKNDRSAEESALPTFDV